MPTDSDVNMGHDTTDAPVQTDTSGLDHEAINASIADMMDSPEPAADPVAAETSTPATDPAESPKSVTLTPEQVQEIAAKAADDAVRAYQAANPTKAAEPTDSELGIRSVAEIEAELVDIGVDAEAAKKQAVKTYEREKAQAKQLHAITSDRKIKAQTEAQRQFVGTVHSALDSLPEAESFYGKEGSRTQEQTGARAMATQLTDLIMEGAKARGMSDAKIADAIAIAHFGVIGALKAQKSGAAAPATQAKPKARVEAQQRPPQSRTFKTEQDLQASQINKEIAQLVEA